MIKKILHTTSLRANIIANFIGNGWAALISILFVPLYLKYIGAEGYGLIGIFASLQVVLSLLDSGLSTTLNKEMSRLNIMPHSASKMRNIVKTLSIVYWGIAILSGLIAFCLSPFLARYWVHPKELSVETITYAFFLLSVTVIFQFPTGFYGGGLLGLQRQVMLNVLRILFATVRSVGAIFVLMFLSNSILAFFAWTLFITALQALTYRYFLWFYLPKIAFKAVFDKQELKNIWRFATGLTAVSLTGILLTQLDSIILSKILLLNDFGYYTLAFTVGSVLYMIVGPVSQSYFPKFSALLAEGNEEQLKRTYHQGCQLVTLLVLPFALFLALFSREILFIWTDNQQTVDNTWKIASVVSLAVAIHCLMMMPYMLCLAYSNTKLAFYTNIILLVFLIPGTIYSAIQYGGLGGALCWLVVTIVYLFVNPILIHKSFLKGEAFNWYWNDTFKPIVICIFIMGIARYVLSLYQLNSATMITMLTLIGVMGFGVTYLSSKELKKTLFKKNNI